MVIGAICKWLKKYWHTSDSACAYAFEALKLVLQPMTTQSTHTFYLFPHAHKFQNTRRVQRKQAQLFQDTPQWSRGKKWPRNSPPIFNLDHQRCPLNYQHNTIKKAIKLQSCAWACSKLHCRFLVRLLVYLMLLCGCSLCTISSFALLDSPENLKGQDRSNTVLPCL